MTSIEERLSRKLVPINLKVTPECMAKLKELQKMVDQAGGGVPSYSEIIVDLFGLKFYDKVKAHFQSLADRVTKEEAERQKLEQ